MRRTDEQAMAALLHLCNVIPLWGLIFCGGMWFINRETSRYMVAQSRQALYFHGFFLFGILVWMLIELVTKLLKYLFPPLGVPLSFLNTLIITGLLIVYIFICLWGAWRCWSGENFRYPFLGEKLD